MTESEICGECNKQVTDDEDGLPYYKCLVWRHRNCLGMSVRTYQKINEKLELKDQVNKTEEEELCEKKTEKNSSEYCEKTEFEAIRLGKNDGGMSPIRVQFENGETKEKLMKSDNKGNLNAQELGFNTDKKIFLNRDLT
ncbi:hypothetical protein HHI36_009740 [Cryptolaemus montrouzieri]|uniref:PARP-type domain-containing protein n=1 Tax=Cryptolaemus montrouzieri TaxID=559131 RepID=A0ABD2MGP5_9CUCU